MTPSINIRFGATMPQLSKLQQDIVKHCDRGTINYLDHEGPYISAPLATISKAVESAYVLTAKADLPKVMTTLDRDGDTIFNVAGINCWEVLPKTVKHEWAREKATAWLAVAAHLEREEAAKAAEEARAKVIAEAAAACAKQARLDEIADEWFGRDFADLGPNKAAVVTEIHRLETQLNAKDEA